MQYLSNDSAFTESFWERVMGYDTSPGGLAGLQYVGNVRQQMLEKLDGCGLAANSPVMRQIADASDLQGLWYLRPNIMQALASIHGEVRARSILGSITPLFAGLLPESMFKRLRSALQMQTDNGPGRMGMAARFRVRNGSPAQSSFI